MPSPRPISRYVIFAGESLLSIIEYFLVAEKKVGRADGMCTTVLKNMKDSSILKELSFIIHCEKNQITS